MIPEDLRPLFWDVNTDLFQPASHPRYTIARILEYGDRRAVAWLRELFTASEIGEVLQTDARLSRRSANFWALVYGIPREEVAALRKAG